MSYKRINMKIYNEYTNNGLKFHHYPMQRWKSKQKVRDKMYHQSYPIYLQWEEIQEEEREKYFENYGVDLFYIK